YPAIFCEEKAVAENNFVGRNEGLAENRLIDSEAFFQPDRVITARVVVGLTHAASFTLRESRRALNRGNSCPSSRRLAAAAFLEAGPKVTQSMRTSMKANMWRASTKCSSSGSSAERGANSVCHRISRSR